MCSLALQVIAECKLTLSFPPSRPTTVSSDIVQRAFDNGVVTGTFKRGRATRGTGVLIYFGGGGGGTNMRDAARFLRTQPFRTVTEMFVEFWPAVPQRRLSLWPTRYGKFQGESAGQYARRLLAIFSAKTEIIYSIQICAEWWASRVQTMTSEYSC